VKHQLRIIPELFFYLDDSLDYIDHIDQLLRNDSPSDKKDSSPEND